MNSTLGSVVPLAMFSNLVGLDIPDYVMTNDDSILLPTSSRHTADMVSLIKRFDLVVTFGEFGSNTLSPNSNNIFLYIKMFDLVLTSDQLEFHI